MAAGLPALDRVCLWSRAAGGDPLPPVRGRHGAVWPSDGLRGQAAGRRRSGPRSPGSDPRRRPDRRLHGREPPEYAVLPRLPLRGGGEGERRGEPPPDDLDGEYPWTCPPRTPSLPQG